MYQCINHVLTTALLDIMTIFLVQLLVNQFVIETKDSSTTDNCQSMINPYSTSVHIVLEQRFPSLTYYIASHYVSMIDCQGLSHG